MSPSTYSPLYLDSNVTTVAPINQSMDLAEKLNANLAAQGKPTFNFFGPNANCTLALCPPTWSVYGYRPALGASVAPLVFFAVALLVHVVLGHRWREWSFMACMICGCVDEMLGYGARVWMYHDLWNFNAFMVQVGKLNSIYHTYTC